MRRLTKQELDRQHTARMSIYLRQQQAVGIMNSPMHPEDGTTTDFRLTDGNHFDSSLVFIPSNLLVVLRYYDDCALTRQFDTEEEYVAFAKIYRGKYTVDFNELKETWGFKE